MTFIYDEYDVVTSESTVYRELKRAKWSWKKVITQYASSFFNADCRRKKWLKNVINTSEIDGKLICVNGQ